LDYELYKTFYGIEIVEKYFKKGMEETKSMCFIYEFWYKWVVEDKKTFINMKKIAKNEMDDIPAIKYKANKEYDEILKLGGFFMHTYNHIDYELDYKYNFREEVWKHVGAVRGDIERYKKYYGDDLNKFVEFWTVSPNQWPKDDPIMKLRIEVFSKHMPNLKNILGEMTKQINELYYDAKKQNTIIEQIKILQEAHKAKYFFKRPKETEGQGFLLKYKMMKEW
jgi:hypothetical protein